ncbi:hypothetical protein Herbaro_21160 [Herbaspirillum sp. WKF16]|uniref:hypothetical protein n=1 Tax=Herbaspirillum sp. WKF16 TaxID=3028312 RepID=UPI0023A96295|nr:hypothetical protein [Herbaspirillum sp. WKF16]WDZ95954.1 hypothetical protein Herbaro_21160 [Herbaspirillum sp. WKF16]
MNGLVELIFEAVQNGAVKHLVDDLLKGGVVIGSSHSELGVCELNVIDENYLTSLWEAETAVSVFIRADQISIGGVLINRPVIRILRYQNSNDVSLIFDSADVIESDREEALRGLAAGAKILAKNSEVPKFYCGFEPATDEKTRLFCGEVMGPIRSL